MTDTSHHDSSLLDTQSEALPPDAGEGTDAQPPASAPSLWRRAESWLVRLLIGLMVLLGAGVLLLAIVLVIQVFWALPVDTYTRQVNAAMDSVRTLDYETVSPTEIAAAYQRAEDALGEIEPVRRSAEYHYALADTVRICRRAYEMQADIVDNPLLGLALLADLRRRMDECDDAWARLDVRNMRVIRQATP